MRRASMSIPRGTSDWHAGDSPDLRSQQEALRRGVDLGGIRSRPVVQGDFEHFDFIVAMDTDNLEELRRRCPEKLRSRLYRCTDFAPELGVEDVPDPYYGGPGGFARVFDIISRGAEGVNGPYRTGSPFRRVSGERRAWVNRCRTV